MKKIALLIGLLILVGGCDRRSQPSPAGTAGTQAQQTRGNELAPRGEHRSGPPPEAFNACEGKTAGSLVQFVDSRGETVKGTCEQRDGKLTLIPDRPRGNSRDEHRGPPPEAFKACEGKTIGSTAQFVDPRGETLSGTCEEEEGKLVLRPDRSHGNSRDGHRGPPPEAFKACEGKTVGSTAHFVDPRGETVKGKCEEEDGKMVLRPDKRRDDRQGQAPDGPEKRREERIK